MPTTARYPKLFAQTYTSVSAAELAMEDLVSHLATDPGTRSLEWDLAEAALKDVLDALRRLRSTEHYRLGHVRAPGAGRPEPEDGDFIHGFNCPGCWYPSYGEDGGE